MGVVERGPLQTWQPLCSISHMGRKEGAMGPEVCDLHLCFSPPYFCLFLYCLPANLVFIFLLVRGKVWRGRGEIWEERDRDLEST